MNTEQKTKLDEVLLDSRIDVISSSEACIKIAAIFAPPASNEEAKEKAVETTGPRPMPTDEEIDAESKTYWCHADPTTFQIIRNIVRHFLANRGVCGPTGQEVVTYMEMAESNQDFIDWYNAQWREEHEEK